MPCTLHLAPALIVMGTLEVHDVASVGAFPPVDNGLCPLNVTNKAAVLLALVVLVPVA